MRRGIPGQRRPSMRVRRLGNRDFLESLEDRVLLAATITVNSVADTDNPNEGFVTLREAIEIANGTRLVGSSETGQVVGILGTGAADRDTIAFNIQGAGPHTIAPTSKLPTITDPVVIDGFTQGGLGYTGPPLIDLNGANAGAGVNGLLITAGSSIIQGLAINRFLRLSTSLPGVFLGGHGILIQGNGGNTIRGNFIGTDASGMAALGNGADGVNITGTNNTIGGAGDGAGNVISGNGADGVLISGNGNSVQGNKIGTDITGMNSLGNSFFGVILSSIGTNNTIGGTIDGAGNVISGNKMDGILAVANGGNLVQGNKIGTDITGMSSLDSRGNSLGNGGNGVLVDVNESNDTIGGTVAGASNVISGNKMDGVRILTSGNLVQGNKIGTDVDGMHSPGQRLCWGASP